MYQVRDNVWLDVRFDGTQYPIDQLGFEFIRVTENNRQFLPTAEMKFADGARWMEQKIKWRDGLPITVSIGKSQKEQNTYNFRLYRYNRTVVQATTTYDIIAYLDNPKYMLDTASKGFTGTSSDALRDLATRCGLKFSGDATADMQYWMPSNHRNCVWAQDVAKHGYINSDSLMQLCVRLDQTMLYRNMSSASVYRGAPRTHFVRHNVIEPNLQIISSSAINTSGYTNAMGGYGFMLQSQPVLGTRTTPVSKLAVRKITRSIDVNEDVQGQIDRGRVRIAPIDCGNTHDKYHQAGYQNERAALVWSNGLNVMVQQTADPTLLDLVEVTDYDQGHNIEEGKTRSGLYIVTARSKQITGSNYFEKYVLFTTGLN